MRFSESRQRQTSGAISAGLVQTTFAMPSAPLVLRPHVGVVSCHDVGNGQHVLLHNLTGEIAKLQTGAWGLSYDARGYGYVYQLGQPGDTTQWVHSLLQYHLYNDLQGQIYARGPERDGSVKVMPLSEWKSRREQDITIKIRVMVGIVDLRVSLFLLPQDGARLFWFLPTIFSGIGLESQHGKLGKWCSSSWDAWSIFAIRLGLPGSHLRKKVQHATPDAALGADPEGTDRLFGERCISCYLLLGLLVKWSSRSQKLALKIPGDRTKTMILLQSLLAPVLQEHSSISVWLGEDAVWRPPAPPTGTGRLELRLEDGALDVTAFLAVLRGRRRRFCELVGLSERVEGECKVRLLDLLLCMVVDKSFDWLLKPMIWQLGVRVEEHWLAQVHVSGEVLRLADLTPKQLEKSLSRYFVASCRLLHGAQFLSMSIDGARLGQQKVNCGVIARADNKGVVFPPQVLPDYVSDNNFADVVDGCQREDARAEWVRRAARWLRKRRHVDDGACSRPKKLARKKAWQWCQCVDNVLEALTGASLEAFQVAEGARPAEWRHLTISCDQGSDGFAAASFLQRHLRLNISFVWDLSHGVWRDIEAVGHHCGLRSLTRLLCVVFNLLHGPWENGMRFHELKESMSEYLELCSPDECPIFRSLYDRIADDFGIDRQAHSDDLMAGVWGELGDHWSMHKKGEKVAMCRFGAWTRTVASFDSAWNFRLLQILYFGLRTGMFSEETFYDVLAKRSQNGAKTRATPTETRVPVGRGNDEVNNMRAACKGNVHLAAVLLSDSTNQVRMRIMYKCTAPVVAWYSEQSKQLRSCPETVDWLSRQLGGEVYDPLRRSWALLGDHEVLESCGMSCSGHQSKQKKEDHELIEQNNFAELMATWIQKLVSVRVKRLLWLVHGLWGRQVVLCSSNEAEALAEATLLRNLCAAYEKAKRRPEPFWKKLVDRCVLMDAPSRQLLETLRAEGWRATSVVQHLVRQRCSAIAQSKISEDAFNIGRRQEGAQGNRVMREKTLWSSIIDHDLASNIHRYEQPAWQQEVVPTGAAGELSKKAFRPSLQRGWPTLLDIVGYKGASWYTGTPDSTNILYADLALLSFADEKDAWGIVAEKCAWAMLFRGANIAYRAKGDERWLFSLGDVSSIAVLGWPAKVSQSKQVWCLEPDLEANPEWSIIVRPEDWECVTLSWQCPLAQLAGQHGRSASAAPERLAVVAVQSGKPRPALIEAAHNAFWTMNLSFMNWLAKEIGANCARGDSLFQVVCACVSTVLPKMSQSQVLDIVSKRLSPPDFYEDLLASDDLSECVHKADKEEFEKEIVQAERQRHTHDTFVQEYRAKRETSINGGADIAKKSLKTSTGKKYPSRYLGHDLTQAQAQEFAPPGWSIYCDRTNLRWQCYNRSQTAKSRAWVLYGFSEACRRVLAAAWDEYTLRIGLPRDACPIENIWEPVGCGSERNRSVPASSSARP